MKSTHIKLFNVRLRLAAQRYIKGERGFYVSLGVCDLYITPNVLVELVVDLYCFGFLVQIKKAPKHDSR